MLEWLRSLFQAPAPAGPPSSLRRFGAGDHPLARSGITREPDGWRVTATEARTVPLYEVADPGAERCILTYRARLRPADVQGGVYLEMWCRFPGRGEFFSRGIDQKLSGSSDWVTRETPFYLKAGQRPDLVKLNLVFEGAGAVSLADVELLQVPLA